MFAELNHITDNNLLDLKVKDYNKGITDLWDTLMGLELQLVDQFEASVTSSINDRKWHNSQLVSNFLIATVFSKVFSGAEVSGCDKG